MNRRKAPVAATAESRRQRTERRRRSMSVAPDMRRSGSSGALAKPDHDGACPDRPRPVGWPDTLIGMAVRGGAGRGSPRGAVTGSARRGDGGGHRGGHAPLPGRRRRTRTAASEQVSLNGTHIDTEQQLTHGLTASRPPERRPQPSQEPRPRTRGSRGPPRRTRTRFSCGTDGASATAGGPGRRRAGPGVYNGLSRRPERVNDEVSQSRHNDGMSPPVGGESPVPPYPAELRHGEPATATTPA